MSKSNKLIARPSLVEGSDMPGVPNVLQLFVNVLVGSDGS